MASLVKHVTLKRSEDYGYGFSVLGGAGSKLPPIVYDIIDGSPASKSCQLSKGDIICEVNEKEVLSCTTKEVLNYLRLSPGEVYLKLKTDTELQEKIQQLIKSPNSADALRTAITQEDLIGVRHILAQKSETQSNSTGGKISKLDSHQSSSSKNSRSSSDYDESSRSSDDSDLLKLKKSDESSCSAMTKPQRVTCATSPPHSEDESDIESLHSFHFSPKAVDMPSVVRLAKRLYALDGFKKTDVSRHLSKNNEFSKSVAEEYLRYFSFKGDTLDAALRKFLDKFCLTGETQERERVLVHFSKRYLDCNPGTFNSQDAVHTLTCALMLLNTDLHSQNVGRKMTSAEFTDNLAELNDGENFSSNVLKFLYEAVKKNPLKWAADEELADIASGQKGKEDGPMIIGSNPFLTAPMGSGIIYKKGYIMRKCCVEPNGKRTAFGKRSWKMWFCVIQDLVLYLHKDEQGARKGPLPQVEQNAVRLHHALAIRAHDYAKKEHVFRLQTADQAEYLLQTSDSKELQAWIDAINFVASSLSAAPMAGAVGSQHKFQRPLLPCSLSKLNIVDQLEDHVKRVAQLEKDLEEHRDRPPDKISCKSTTISCYKEKEVYLACEIKRYQTYVSLLKSRLEGASGALSGALDMVSDLPVFETNKAAATAGGDDSTAATDSSGEVKREDVPWVVPPPIPDRPRTTDSSDDASVEKQTQTTLKKDDFKKELEKLLKENEKREKKAQKKEESQNTLTRKKKNKDAINSPEETKPVDETEIQTQINDKKTKLTANECEEKMKPQEESLKSPEAQLGTMDKLKAVFKFSKLNRENTKAVTNKEEIIQMETVAQTETKTLPLIDDDDDVPPPLPPKPAAATAARMNLYMGTRIDI